MDLRDFLEPDRDARLDDDLAAVGRALDALPELWSRWGRLPAHARAEYAERWRARMLTLESLPGRLYRHRPTLRQRAEYMRLADRSRELLLLIDGLGLYPPRLS